MMIIKIIQSHLSRFELSRGFEEIGAWFINSSGDTRYQNYLVVYGMVIEI